jgi:hypothetical protein
MVVLSGFSDPSFNGWFNVGTVADSTHFTAYSNLYDTRNGASTTSPTLGTASWYNVNHITVAVIEGAWKFIVYSDRASPGTFVPVCQSNPQGSQNTDLTCDDYGSPMNDNQSYPPFIPTSPPVSAANDNLSTTIVGGAGTTSIVVASNAGTTVNGVGARIDACPGILAAATASAGLTGNLTIPADPGGGSFVINSYCQMNKQVAVSQIGNLYLNETLEYTPAIAGYGSKWYGEMMPQFGSGVGPGSFQSNVTVTVNTARPGMYWGGEFGNSISGVTFNCLPSNGCLAFLEEGGFNQSHERLNFFSQGGANDYLTILLYERGKAAVQSATGVLLDRVEFGPGASTGAPAWFCNDCGVTYARSVYQVHRGNVIVADPAGTSFKVGDLSYINGGGTPLYTVVNGVFVSSAGTIIMDTIAWPCFAGLSTGASYGATFNAINAAGCSPASGQAPFSGNWSFVANQGFPQNKNSNGIANAPVGLFDGVFNGPARNGEPYTVNINQMALATGKSYPIFIAGQAPVAPRCSVSAGGSLKVGKYQFKVVPTWQNGAEGTFSSISPSCTTSTGYQAIEINWTGVPGNPTGYVIYSCHPNGSTCSAPGGINPQPASSTSAVWSSNGGNYRIAGIGQTSLFAGGPTMLMPGTQGISADRYTVNGNCSSSAVPAVCGSAASGSVVVASGATTVTVNTTAISANSIIHLTFDSSLGTKLGVTCNATPVQPTVSARTAGRGFVLKVPMAPTTNPACFSYTVVN